jgi:Kdo2-lipid IVA lauroyltransferase/acyltransferase
MVSLLNFFSRLMAALPRGAVDAIGRGAGRLFGFAGRRQRRTALQQLRQCLPDRDDAGIRRLAREMFENAGLNVVEVLRWIGGGSGDFAGRIAAPTDAPVREALARGRGALILTAHVGNFDLMGLWAASQFPLTIISKEIKSPALNRFWMEKRGASGLRILPAHGSYRDCLRLLKRNEVLGFILDQNMTREEGIFVDFFGRPACTTPGLAVLSAHSGAPVVPVFIVRRGRDRHEAMALPLIDPPPDRKPETIREYTQRYTRVIEDVVRAHPGQWIWMHRRWRTRPPGESPPEK